MFDPTRNIQPAICYITGTALEIDTLFEHRCHIKQHNIYKSPQYQVSNTFELSTVTFLGTDGTEKQNSTATSPLCIHVRDSPPRSQQQPIALKMFIISQPIWYYGYILKNPHVVSINQKGKQVNREASKFGTIQA